MKINKISHLKHISISLDELWNLSKQTAAPSDLPFQYIGTIIDNTIGLLTSSANSLDNGDRKVVFSMDKNWVSLMQSVHRSFISTIHIAIEKALAEQCFNVEIVNKKKIDSLLIDLEGKLSNKHKKILKSLIPKKPSFNDYLETTFKENSNISECRKKIWRAYFKCLSIVRNKISHADCSLSNAECNELLLSGFKAVVKNNKLQFNPRVYAQICNHIIQFFQELGFKLKQ